MSKARVSAAEGWFETGDDPHLVGLKCGECGTYAFPPVALACPNPGCAGTADDLAPTPLSRTGKVWSYSVNHYEAPEPSVRQSPYAVAAVELAEEQMVVLGQVVPADLDKLAVGAGAELTVGTLYEDDESEYLVWRWRIV